jgi:hypothetical protein
MNTKVATEMLFQRGNQFAEQCQAQDADNRELYDLLDVVGFAAEFFVPLMNYEAA